MEKGRHSAIRRRHAYAPIWAISLGPLFLPILPSFRRPASAIVQLQLPPALFLPPHVQINDEFLCPNFFEFLCPNVLPGSGNLTSNLYSGRERGGASILVSTVIAVPGLATNV